MAETDFRIWMLRAGSRSYLLDEFLRNEIAAIGWNDLGQLDKGLSYENLKDLLSGKYANDSKASINQSAGQIWKFFKEFKIGDKIITYDSDSRIYITGVVSSDYQFSDKFTYHHFRNVKWDGTPIERDLLKIETKNTLGSILTIFEISKSMWDELMEVHPGIMSQGEFEFHEEMFRQNEAQELERLKEDVVFRSSEFIKDIISNLSWQEMEDLSLGLLKAMGYKTRKTQKKGGDLGSDIMASPDGLSMVEPIIKVEVKHRAKSKEKVSAPEVRSFIGGLRAPTKGIYISSTGFTKEAYYEAERANFQTTLIDFDFFVDLIVEYYEKLNPETKALVPLQKIYWPV